MVLVVPAFPPLQKLPRSLRRPFDRGVERGRIIRAECRWLETPVLLPDVDMRISNASSVNVP